MHFVRHLLGLLVIGEPELSRAFRVVARSSTTAAPASSFIGISYLAAREALADIPAFNFELDLPALDQLRFAKRVANVLPLVPLAACPFARFLFEDELARFLVPVVAPTAQ